MAKVRDASTRYPTLSLGVKRAPGSELLDRPAEGGSPDAVEGAAMRARVSASAPASTNSGANTVVVVDDEEDIRETVKDVLEREGYSVEVAGNGVHAMAILKLMASHPRLIIIDLSMPWMDGKAMLAALKSDPALADIPVIISTADPSPAPEGVPVLKKPLDVDLLLEALESEADVDRARQRTLPPNPQPSATKERTP